MIQAEVYPPSLLLGSQMFGYQTINEQGTSPQTLLKMLPSLVMKRGGDKKEAWRTNLCLNLQPELRIFPTISKAQMI